MANSWYLLGLQKFLRGEIDWDDDDIKCILVDLADYTPNFTTDEFLSDIAGAAVVKTSGNLSGKSSTLGVADCADITLSTVAGDQSEAIIFYMDSGSPATSPLICLFDTAQGLPVTPSGTNITIQIDPTGLFQL